MNINQDNYESFFLLYVDNELSAAERLCVEAFIGQNPNLAAELETLREMVLPADETQMLDKSALYRSDVLDENMQEAMLLHIDNELPEASKNELLKKIEEEAPVSASWEMLKKAKLDATEVVAFPHKKTLYRKERTNNVVYGRFTRWAVAAALIAAGFFAGVLIVKDRDKAQTEFATVDATKPAVNGAVETPTQNNTASVSDHTGVSDETNAPAVPALKDQSPGIAAVELKDANKNNTSRQNPASLEPTKRSGSRAGGEALQNVGPKQQPVMAAANEKLDIKKEDRQEVATVLASVERPKQPVEIIDRNMTPAESSYAYNTIMEEPEQNDNHILFMDEETVARSKAGIFFKKLKRTVTRSTNIKTGNSLKIAGFEFAVK